MLKLRFSPTLNPLRYFAELAYNGTNYHGWQRQPNSPSVQSTIETALSTILRTETAVTGCGRTDTGVHASQYYLHFDYDGNFPKAFTRRLNKFLPNDIAIKSVFEVKAETHARFDAYYRKYEYHLNFDKNPFTINISYHYHFARDLDISKMQEVSKLLLKYENFFSFCKSNSDVKNMLCSLYQAEWKAQKDHLVFHIAANRFLRGMVRLIVGMCLNVGLGKINIDQVIEAMDQQIRLEKNLSVPAKGLFLTEVKYPPDKLIL